MKRIMFLLGMLLLTVACATTDEFVRIADTWLGAESAQLIKAWGKPTRVYTFKRSEFIAYSSSSTTIIHGIAPSATTTFSENTAYTTYNKGIPTRYVESSCMIVFEARQGRIISLDNQRKRL